MVLEKKHLKEARKAHPGKVIYLPPELQELRRLKDAPDYLKALEVIHLVKKKFGAWIIPSDSPSRGGTSGRRELMATDSRNGKAHPLEYEAARRSGRKSHKPARDPDVPEGDGQEAFTF